jgi:antitoxin Phd
MNMERKRSAVLGGGSSTAWPAEASRGEVVTMTSTEAQNGFGRVLDAVARGGTVLITKHNATQAVVMSVDRYEALTRAESPSLDALTAEFDAMLERMQTPEARAGIHAGLSASPAELGRLARAAAQQRDG